MQHNPQKTSLQSQIHSNKESQNTNSEENRFQINDCIGNGTYGEVYRCFDRKLNRTVAVKKMKIPNDGQGIPSTVLREISLLRDFNHEFIIALLDVIIKPSKILLIFEFIKQDLKQSIDNLQPTEFMSLNSTKVCSLENHVPIAPRHFRNASQTHYSQRSQTPEYPY